MATNDILVKLKLDSSQYDKGITKSEKETKNFSKSSTASLKTLAAGFLSVGVAVQQIGKGFKDLAQETEGIAKVRSVLKSTGGVAGVTAQNIEDMTLAMQKNTLISQDSARNVASLGLTFTKISKDVFPEYLKMAADMATVTGQDMSNSALQLGKALQDPVLGATALRRVGVNLTKSQSEQIKTFVKLGQTAKAQAIIMKELATEFGGAAKAVGQTFFGSVKRALNAVDDFRKAFVKGLGAGAFGDVQKLFEYIVDNQVQIGENFRKIGYIFTHNFIMDAIKGTAKLLKFSFDGWMQIGKLWESIFGNSFFEMIIKGWKMIFAYVEGGWSILFTLVDDMEGIFQRATNNIGIMFQQMFNKVRDANPFSDFDSTTANAKLEGQKQNVFGSSTVGAWDKLNEDIFSINMGLDTRQRDANFALSKSTFDLAGGGGNIAMSPVLEATKEHYAKTEEATKTHWQQEALNRAKEAEEEAAKKDKARLDEIAKQDAFRAKMLSVTAQTFSGMENAFNVLSNASLNNFGKATGIIGGFSSVIDTFAPGLGTAIGAGASFLGTVFGQKEEESTSSGISSTSASALKSDTTRPSATITRTGPEVQNNYLNLTVGNWLGDEQGINDLSALIAEKIGGMQAGMA